MQQPLWLCSVGDFVTRSPSLNPSSVGTMREAAAARARAGTKTVAAKAMPKKPSVVSRVLKSCNVSPRLLKQMLTGLGLAASIVVFLVVIIAIIVISAKMK